MKQMFLEFKTQQEQKIEKIYTFIAEIKQQNSEICYSADFLSKSYDSLVGKIEKLESDRQTNHDYIRTLEDKLERAECYTRATCLEVRNIPVPNKESKPQLLNTITNLGKLINVTIQSHEVRDVFRTRSKGSEHKPIIVDFTSVIMKEKFIYMYKQFKKSSALTTELLKMAGPIKPIYVSENLSAKMKRLFFLVRDFARVNNFKYSWSSHGKIYLRKSDGAPHYIIKDESELSKVLK
ncbi:unnamed protein product [Arctia plantaginis]|uniref:FP protein C-terminal domain-containing protein n=1 Tax=Arctia plantaginis TaxID=874455 RepID=A0A8S1BNL5_ARCPL|nr:unnamed protein product [Arctia plantaginis]